MTHKHFGTFLALALTIAVPAFAAPAVNAKADRPAIIPAHAIEVADGVFDLGVKIDPATKKPVRGYAIVHYRDGENHNPNHNPPGGGGNGNGGGGSSCYGFLARDAKWKTTEDWIVNATNPDGLSDSFVLNTLATSIAQWEDAADGALGGGSINILGNGSLTNGVLEADTVSPDDQNEVYFDLLDEGTIGVTIVWGIFGGPPSGRELVEWDQVYSTFYGWSDSGEAGMMDFWNIAIHELGHSVGLGDLYQADCSNETMYGYVDFGEINKRDLNAGDIAGISKLY